MVKINGRSMRKFNKDLQTDEEELNKLIEEMNGIDNKEERIINNNRFKIVSDKIISERIFQKKNLKIGRKNSELILK